MGSSNNRLKDYGKEILKSIKYEPISSSIKPVHIANGLFRLVIKEEYDITPLNEWVIRFKQGKEINSVRELRAKYSDLIDEDTNDDELNKLRYFLELIFNADNAGYPNVNFSTLTIASKTQVTSKVQNEYKIPQFIYNILATRINGEESSCINLIQKYLNNDSDELSRIAYPLTNNNYVKKNKLHIDEANEILSGVELRIREAFDRLALNQIKTNTNKLLSLERIVLFTCFSVILHLSSRIIDISSKYNDEDRIPMLFDGDGSLDPIKYASQECLKLSKLVIEEYFEKTLEEILKGEGYNEFTHEEMLERIEVMPIADSGRKRKKTPEAEKRRAYKDLYLSFYEQSSDPFDAIIKATVFKLFSDEYSTDPSSFISSFGAKIGLVFGRGRRRFLVQPTILETILLTIIEKDKPMNLNEFGKKLWQQYGIIIGANPELDYQHLFKWKISQSTPGDLAGCLSKNAKIIADKYIAMGYAKRYADGVTILSLDL